ncbi:MAG TPA: RNB domain-containing ribonuclease [Steroidobacteraceae bacterium]|nr:RNB domain-containing ribonuclease [Steroidobacteraceae bacterium]
MQSNNLDSIARQAMIEHGLQPDFSPEAQRQADSLSQADATTRPAIRDLRALLWSSIDNDDTRDLDQLAVSEPLAGGAIKVLIAIADVDAFVERGSAIDDHARSNTTSVYTAAKVFPMLPEKLSTDLTSLLEGDERLAVVIEMTIDARGRICASDIYRALVLNRAKLTYDGVAAWLDGNAPPPSALASVAGLDRQLRDQDKVAQTLRRLRYEHGALNFETVQARPVFNEGVLTDMRADERNRAKELIEDFMVAANGVVARYLQGKGRSLLRRVLRSPERWPRIVALAAGVGERLPARPDAAALNAFLAARRSAEPETFPELSLSVLKLLGSSEYAVELPNQPAEGHFGLAVNEYTHSTAPNRRFPDLITQRLVKAALTGDPAAYTDDELRELAAHCTAQEKSASKVERQVRKAATALLLVDRIGQQFNGVVTGASEKGTWVRISHPIAEGKVVRGSSGLDVGDRVRVELVHVDPGRGFIDFATAR